MRYLLTNLCLVLAVLFIAVLSTTAAHAQDDPSKEVVPRNEDRANRRAEMREKMIKEFDADGDGELSEEERGKAREAMRERFGNRGDRRRGPGGPPDPGKLFDKYDANNDGQLSRAEFMKLSKEMRPPRPPRGPGAAGGRGPRAEGDRPRGDRPRGDRKEGPRADGPPPEGRRFELQRPLQNPGSDSEGPRARPAGRRLDDKGPPRRRGPRDRGPEGWQPPSPEEVFNRFDENQDDQLSREEFMKLADRMRQMRERRHGPPPERGAREGRGPRRGAPGEEGQPRRGRPHRPEMESDAGPNPSAEDDSV